MSSTRPITVSAPALDNGLANMIADLVRQNLADHPQKLTTFDRLRGRVAIVAEDADVALTLEFRAGELRVHDGIVGVPDVCVRADSEDVINLSLLELVPRLGWPDPRGRTVRAIADATRAGRLRVVGGLMHLPLLLRLTRVMSVN